MGYETTYSGRIKVGKNTITTLKQLFEDDEKLYEHFLIDGIIFEDDYIEISGYDNLYKEELEKLCLFIVMIDESSVGEVVCYGEESGDLWRIDICDGGVEIREGEIVYKEVGRVFKSSDVDKEVYKITKDEKLLKEIIIEELNDGKK